MPDPSSQDCCGRATVRNFISPQRELPPRCSRAPTRREYIRLLGGATGRRARAATDEAADHRLPGQSTLAVEGPRLAAFLKRLRELGWIEGRTIAIEYGWGEGSGERFAKIAADFVRLKVDVIVTSGTANVVAAKQATSTTPIVFAVATSDRQSSRAWRDRAATSRGFRPQPPILPASESSSCARLFPVCAIWQSSGTSAIRFQCWR